MSGSRWTAALAALVLLLGACMGVVDGREARDDPRATLVLDGERVRLTPTSCALVGARLLERLPAGGSETTLTATGRLEDGRQVQVTVRRGTDELPPERFELLEISLGSIERDVESLVGFRGREEATGAWSQVDPDAAGARRPVPGGFVEVDGPRLVATATLPRPSDGVPVDVRLDVTCPLDLEPAPGTA